MLVLDDVDMLDHVVAVRAEIWYLNALAFTLSVSHYKQFTRKNHRQFNKFIHITHGLNCRGLGLNPPPRLYCQPLADCCVRRLGSRLNPTAMVRDKNCCYQMSSVSLKQYQLIFGNSNTDVTRAPTLSRTSVSAPLKQKFWTCRRWFSPTANYRCSITLCVTYDDFPARASGCIYYGISVCMFTTLRYCVKTRESRGMRSSPSSNPVSLSFLMPRMVDGDDPVHVKFADLCEKNRAVHI